jgi:hypothetical protein
MDGDADDGGPHGVDHRDDRMGVRIQDLLILGRGFTGSSVWTDDRSRIIGDEGHPIVHLMGWDAHGA